MEVVAPAGPSQQQQQQQRRRQQQPAAAAGGDVLRPPPGVLRPGIVHRLDKGTSGLMVVAKDDLSHMRLCDQFKARTVGQSSGGGRSGSPARCQAARALARCRCQSLQVKCPVAPGDRLAGPAPGCLALPGACPPACRTRSCCARFHSCPPAAPHATLPAEQPQHAPTQPLPRVPYRPLLTSSPLQVSRIYQSVVLGVPSPAAGRVATNIARDPNDRLRMAALGYGAARGRAAASNYRVLRRVGGGAAALVEWRLETGRTHQISRDARAGAWGCRVKAGGCVGFAVQDKPTCAL